MTSTLHQGVVHGNNIRADEVSLHSPNQRLPSELWSMIFVRCLPSSGSPTYDDDIPEELIRDPRLTPMVLASVSQIWRQIACSTAVLWATCWMNFQHPGMNRIWLQRAGACELYLYGRSHKRLKKEYDWTLLFLSIYPFQDRWRSLELEMQAVGAGIMSSIIQFDCPMLQTFKLRRCGGLPNWMGGILSNAPRLRELEVETLMFWNSEWGPSGVWKDVPFKNLSTLKLDATNGNEAIWFLQSLPQLQNLSISSGSGLRAIMQTLPTVRHTNLLNLQIDEEFEIPVILDKLILPSLVRFHMQYTFACGIFLDFVGRSGCRITELTIGDPYISSLDIIRTLRDLPNGHSIERLELPWYDNYITPSFFNSLLDDKNGRTLPHLTQLLFRGIEFRNIPEGLVADLVISRCIPRSCQCEECLVGARTREVRLQYGFLGDLDKDTHILDIARLIPLPGDRQGEEQDAVTVLDLRILKWDRSSDLEREACLYPVKIFVGGAPSRSEALSDSL